MRSNLRSERPIGNGFHRLVYIDLLEGRRGVQGVETHCLLPRFTEKGGKDVRGRRGFSEKPNLAEARMSRRHAEAKNPIFFRPTEGLIEKSPRSEKRKKIRVFRRTEVSRLEGDKRTEWCGALELTDSLLAKKPKHAEGVVGLRRPFRRKAPSVSSKKEVKSPLSTGNLTEEVAEKRLLFLALEGKVKA